MTLPRRLALTLTLCCLAVLAVRWLLPEGRWDGTMWRKERW